MSIRMKANDFFNAYLVLKENNEALSKDSSNLTETLPERKDVFGKRPTMGVDIVCLAFSVELYIKDLHYTIESKVPRGHNIFKLFEKLPEEIRQEIFSYDSVSKNPFCTRGSLFSTKRFTSDYRDYDGFIDQIKAISNGFEKWRYSYESTVLHYDISFALALIESIKAAAAGNSRKHGS